jgi:hypothetical protein
VKEGGRLAWLWVALLQRREYVDARGPDDRDRDFSTFVSVKKR